MPALTPTTILYIEDDEFSAHLMERLLVKGGFAFRHAATGLAGIELAGQIKPDLILVDINLPDIDGLVITTRLRTIESLQHTPIVAITSHSQKEGRQLALASGCDGYITKPINTRTVISQITDFLEGHQEKLSAKEEQQFLKVHTADVVQQLEGRVRQLAETNQQLQAANAQLREIDQQRARFFNIVSHELRTPFTPIRGYIDLLRDGAMGPLNPAQKHAVNIVANNLNNALRLLDDLLDLSKLKASGITMAPEPFSIKALLEEVAVSGRAFVENSEVDFRVDIADTLPCIQGDRGRIRQVILNLLNNAVKFTEKGSITLLARTEHDRVVIEVKDTGMGLLPDEIPHVFDEFWQSEDIHGTGIGTGLGLAISRYLVQAHGGKIWLDSEKGVGTTVSFSLPLAKDQNSQP
jgi:signal transduction histidine kinase